MIELRLELAQTYDVIQEIGAGGGGVIYKAYHKRLQKYVVLKKIHSNMREVLNKRSETDILKNLRHSYLPQVIDFLEINDEVYTVMDFIPGKSFEQLLKENVNFTNTQILKYTEQLCEVMAYLHSRKLPIMHGDIKPANIMRTPDDNICLIDFNISGVLSKGSMVTVGYSVGYAAPEQFMAVELLRHKVQKEREYDKTEILADSDGETVLLSDDTTLVLEETDVIGKGRESITLDKADVHIDLRADVYSIGATIYHLATGRRFGVKKSDSDIAASLMEELEMRYSNGFGVIILKALETEPDRRFQDASEMLRAVKNMHKYDKKYKAMLIRQELTLIVLILMVGVSVFLMLTGRQKMNLERLENYEDMIGNLILARESGLDEFDSLYDQACNYMPQRTDAHYQKAILLAEKEQYEQDIDFINRYLLNSPDFMVQSYAADTYYLMGNCYFELEDYKEAVVYYQAAVNLNAQVSQYYGDYAISLVYCGRIDQAQEVLRQGRERGMGTDYILLVTAEIEVAKEQYDDAVMHFQECIQTTKNEDMKLRAYVLCDKALRKKGNTEEVLLASVNLLHQAQTEISLSNQLLILERLAQVYIDLGTIKEDSAYNDKALEVFDQIVQYGWDNYTTHINRAILYEKQGDFEQAKEILQQLEQQDRNNYVTYKRLAILEMDIQGNLPVEERSYSRFVSYYHSAVELYEKTEKNKNDVEIQWLEKAYTQVEAGGWLEE